MKQTIEDPRVNVEENLDDAIKEKWHSLADEDKIMHKMQFIADLKYEYHKPFFERLDIARIINERWFRQYFGSLHFAKDEFER